MTELTVDHHFVAQCEAAASGNVHRIANELQKYVGAIYAANASKKLNEGNQWRRWKASANNTKIELTKWLTSKKTNTPFRFKSEMTCFTHKAQVYVDGD